MDYWVLKDFEKFSNTLCIEETLYVTETAEKGDVNVIFLDSVPVPFFEAFPLGPLAAERCCQEIPVCHEDIEDMECSGTLSS